MAVIVYSQYGGGMFLQNAGNHITDHTVLEQRELQE
jgi:hypothetical protein